MDILVRNLEGIRLEIPERYYLIAWLQCMLAKNLKTEQPLLHVLFAYTPGSPPKEET